MSDPTEAGEPAPDLPRGAEAPRNPSRWERAVLALFLAAVLVGGGWGGLWFLRLWRDPAWGPPARQTLRVRATLAAEPANSDVRARYAQELLQLAALSPPPLRGYLDWRADRQCAEVRRQTPPGTFASCRRMHLDRLLLRRDGPGLMAAALQELEGAPPEWHAPLYRYAGRGAVLHQDWDAAREHFGTAFGLGRQARDAFRAGWVCLHVGQPAVALDWLDRAFRANGGYPSPRAYGAAGLMLAPDERARYTAGIQAEAAFYDACRSAALSGLDGQPAAIPPWPENI